MVVVVVVVGGDNDDVYDVVVDVVVVVFCFCTVIVLKVTAAKRKEDQKVKEQVKKEDQKIKRARVDIKKDTVSCPTTSPTPVFLCHLLPHQSYHHAMHRYCAPLPCLRMPLLCCCRLQTTGLLDHHATNSAVWEV